MQSYKKVQPLMLKVSLMNRSGDSHKDPVEELQTVFPQIHILSFIHFLKIFL